MASTTDRRAWLEQVAKASQRFDRGMKEILSVNAYTGTIGPEFDLAQANLRRALKRLDPARATTARLKLIAELAEQMLAARSVDGPQAFLYNTAPEAILELQELAESRPALEKPTLSPVSEAPFRPQPPARPSSLAQEPEL